MEPVTVGVAASRCVRSAWARADCDRCVVVCPDRAIVLAPGPLVSDACSSCGACVAVCPHDAFTAADDDEAALGQRLADGGGRLSCSAAPVGEAPASEVVLRCLGRLSADALVHAAALGASRLRARSADCASCPSRVAVRYLGEAIELARVLAAAAGLELEVELTGDAAAARAAARSGARRSLLRGLVSSFVTTAPERQSRARRRRTALRRRAALLERLRETRRAAAAGDPASFWPFGRVQVAPSRCTGCHACERICPVTAIRRVPIAGGARLTVHQDRCTGCWACAAGCVVEAITVSTPSAADVVADAVVSELVVQRPTCHVCGQPSDTPAGVPCRLCWRSEHRLGARPTPRS